MSQAQAKLSPPAYKIVLLGDSSVGKTSLVHRFINNRFDTSIPNTIGAAFITKEYTSTTSEKTIKLEIWDTAGQERYRSLTPMYYRNSKLALVCFDFSDFDTFEKGKYWIDQLELLKDTQDIKVKLVGNKYDLIEQDPSKVEEIMTQIEPYLQERNLSIYKTSAKTGFGITELFDDIVNDIDDKFFDDYYSQNKHNENNSNSLNLLTSNSYNPYNSCC